MAILDSCLKIQIFTENLPDADEVWQIVKELPELAEDIEQILSGH
jgi:hypothetical protein